MQRIIRWTLFILLTSSCILTSGCAFIGVAAYKLAPPPTIYPEYKGLQGQTIGIMVWADRGIRIDWQNLQLDLANGIEKNLKASKKKDVEGASYPVQPASIVRYQKDHPEIEAMHVTEVAPRLGVSRLIYVELDDFATRSDMSVDLYRGTARATVRLIEIADGKAHVAFETNKVMAIFPKKSPQEGVPGVGDGKIYPGLVDVLAIEVAHLFVTYQVEE